MNISRTIRNTICISIFLTLAYPGNILAQVEKSKQFDFWIGEWEIEQKILSDNGEWIKFPATTEVEYILERNVMVENWEGKVQFFWAGMEAPEEMKGYSIRYFDEVEDQWVIYWMDTMNPSISVPYKGNFLKEGYGEFYRSNNTANGIRYSRIIFNRKDEKTVEWTLAISGDRKTRNTIWMMGMRKK